MADFSFPYAPYGIQVALMKEIWKCLEERKIGILESPTGTGKSLSTICAVLTWLESFEKRERERIQQEVNDGQTVEYEESDDWVAAYKKKFEAKKKASVAEEDLENIKKIDEWIEKARSSLVGGKRKFIEEEQEDEVAPEEDADSEIAPDENYSSDGEVHLHHEEKQPSCLKIFYASRTHSQLEQFSAEILKTRFRPRIVTVASRQTLCLYEPVHSLKCSNLIIEKCNELRRKKTADKRLKDEEKVIKRDESRNGCPFGRADAVEELANQVLNLRARSLLDVVEIGTKCRACAYFATRKALPLCQLVLLPYQALLHKPTREAWSIELRDNIIVIDEAHNLLETVGAMHSIELSHLSVTLSLSLIREYIGQFRLRLKSKNLLYMRQLLSLVSAFERLLSVYSLNNSDTVFTMTKFLLELNCAEIDFFKLLHYMEKTHLCKKFNGFFLRYKNGLITGKENVNKSQQKKLLGIDRLLTKKELFVQSTSEDERKQKTDEVKNSSSPLFLIKQFTESLTTKCSDARIIIERATAEHPTRFKFILLNPADKLIDVVKAARSVVLIGGTMNPADHLIHSLQKICQVPMENIVRFSCGHVVDDDQLMAITVGKAPNGRELSLTYGNRGEYLVLKGIAMTLINLLRHVPSGAVAFFPSYEFMSIFVTALKTSSLYDKLNETKPIFFESKSDSSKLWNDFARQARTLKGALLCAVVGGKLSEGINFSDELGRCVFMIGLPYPNKNSLELVEKMKYLDATLGTGSGSIMYETCCIHLVNQAIGRAIRHRKDYAAIVLIDSRFSCPSILRGLPEWISSRLKHCTRFGEAVMLISQFFKLRGQLNGMKFS